MAEVDPMVDDLRERVREMTALAATNTGDIRVLAESVKGLQVVCSDLATALRDERERGDSCRSDVYTRLHDIEQSVNGMAVTLRSEIADMRVQLTREAGERQKLGAIAAVKFGGLAAIGGAIASLAVFVIAGAFHLHVQL